MWGVIRCWWAAPRSEGTSYKRRQTDTESLLLQAVNSWTTTGGCPAYVFSTYWPNVNIWVIFLFLGNFQWSDQWLFYLSQSKLLQPDWLMRSYLEKQHSVLSCPFTIMSNIIHSHSAYLIWRTFCPQVHVSGQMITLLKLCVVTMSNAVTQFTSVCSRNYWPKPTVWR